MSFCSICLIVLIAELNDMAVCQAHVGNDYLDAYTKEKCISLPFRMEGHRLVISKALYRLCTSGK